MAVVTPASAVVSLEEAKAHLRVDHSDEDLAIEAFVAAATAHLDGPSGVLNRALGAQVLQATIDGFPSAPMALRCEPVTAINDVTYIDATGAEVDVDPDIYELSDDACLQLEFGRTWPTPRSASDRVRILYTAGYPTLPPPLKAAILLMVGDLYANRETVVIGTISASIAMSTTVEALIAPYRNLRA